MLPIAALITAILLWSSSSGYTDAFFLSKRSLDQSDCHGVTTLYSKNFSNLVDLCQVTDWISRISVVKIFSKFSYEVLE
jgi:hypothetical protein